MPNTIKPLVRSTLNNNSSTIYYTAPAGTTTVITSIVATNISASAATVTVSLNDIVILNAVSVPANSATVIDLKQAINATQTIKAGASGTSAISLHITGVEIT